MILPRQARDKHRENSKKHRFLAGQAAAAAILVCRQTHPFEIQNEQSFLFAILFLLRQAPASSDERKCFVSADVL
eukprot:COSAG06_NODE_2369_length_6995_cov_7.327001_3_plen_75_part_00